MQQSRTVLAAITIVCQFLYINSISGQCPEITQIDKIQHCMDGTTSAVIWVTEPEDVEYSIDNGANFQQTNVFANLNPGDYLVYIKKGVTCGDFGTFQIAEFEPSIEQTDIPLDLDYNCNSEVILEVEGNWTKYTWYRNGNPIKGENYKILTLNKDDEEGEYYADFRNSEMCGKTESYTFDKIALAYYLEDDTQAISCTDVFDLVPYTLSVGNATPGESDGAFVINIESNEPLVYSIDGGNVYSSCNNFDNLKAGIYEVVVSNGSECMRIEVEIVDYVESNIQYLTLTGSICRILALEVDFPEAYDFQWYKNGLALENETNRKISISKWEVVKGDFFYASFSSPQGDLITGRYITDIREYHVDLGTKFICQGDTAFVSGFPYSGQGQFQFKTSAADGCDSTTYVTIVVLPETQCGDSFFSGALFYDANRNGFHDHNERGIPDVPLRMIPQDLTLFVSSKGLFYYQAEEGLTYNIGVDLSNEPLGKWEITTDQSEYSIVFEKGNPLHQNLNIGLVHEEDFYEGRIFMSPLGSRCNTEESASIYFTNLGNAIKDDEKLLINFEVDPNYTVLESEPMPAGQVNNIYSYHFSDLKSYEQISIRLLLETPDESHTGETSVMKSNAMLLKGTEEIVLDDFEKIETVRCSYDPNDKQVSPIGVDDEHYTLFEEKLTYTIRFQNTGNDTAYDVKIKDVLDENLDLTTFKLVGSSHDMTTSLFRNEVEFLFKDIQLPDSTANEPLSHGYIIYEIEALKGIAENTLITNTADIFFDLNPPITTNTTMNLMVEHLPTTNVLELNYLDFEAKQLDNEEVLLNWSLPTDQNIERFKVERSSNAEEWVELVSMANRHSYEPVSQYEYTDHYPMDGLIYYRIIKINFDGSTMYSIIRSVKNQNRSAVVLFPNPISRDQLLTILTQSTEPVKLSIADKLGRSIIETQLQGRRQTIAIHDLQPGVYFCTILGSGIKKTFKLVVS